jgi:hypothetical protein
MKRHDFGRRGVTIGLALTTSILATGCTHFVARRAHARAQLEEHSRALTTAVVDSLQLQPPDERDAYSEFALRVAREDQRIEGLPLKPVAVEPFVQTNQLDALPKLKAERALEKRFTEIEKLLATERTQNERLLEFGQAHETEQNVKRVRWTKWLGGSSLLLAGLVALCVFVPAAIPILGRVLGWVVAKLPSVAGWVGVVSVKAFDAVVHGIERTKASSAAPSASPSGKAGLSNENSGSSQTWSEALDVNLSREMDASHKALVRARKAVLPGGAR